MLSQVAVAEEFNKYLSYVRNLGFEDTPDYDYLRELFTQALKNTGEVEDGEYDWMKLNNGKGWEAMKHHPSQHLSGAHLPPARAAGTETPRGPGTPGLSQNRLNQPQPQLPNPQKPGVPKRNDKPGASGGLPIKRQSGALGPLNDVTPTASTQAQFQSSTMNLPPRSSQVNPGLNQSSTAHQGTRNQNAEPQPSTMQKIMKALCCGR